MIREKQFIRLRDNVELHTQISEKGSKIWLIATHGIGEHLERHDYLYELFGSKFNICQYDLRGHGLSTGEVGYVEDFFDYMKDLQEVIFYLKERYKMDKFVLFAHSMGALITSGYIQKYADEETYPSLVYLNAPPVGFAGGLGKFIEYAPKGIFKNLAKIPVSVRVGGLLDLNYLSHDPRVKENYVTDNRNLLQLHTKLLLEVVKGSSGVFNRPLRPRCPAFVSVGTEDRIVGYSQLRKYFTMVEKSFNYREFEGAYHEIHNEIEKYRKPYFEHVKASVNSIWDS